ncbi:uncharacterized protein K02A2.6-like [Dermacentor silvarum]|nr:uncharacterized protein K02A2.6-like [Dermacentor silvarum]
MKAETDKDTLMTELCRYASTEWPQSKQQLPDALKPYWSYRDELHVEDGLLLRSNKLIIPPAKRKEVLGLLHAAHCGEDKMKARARQVMYWPNMNANISDVAKSCAVCDKYKKRNAKLPMLSHELPSLPWQFVGVDLFHHEGNDYLIVVDSYSFFFEVRKLNRTTATAVINASAEIFATHGIPAKLCSDNGPPFNSATFQAFTSQFNISHTTSSPYYPRANGLAERAVQEAKHLLNKCPFSTLEFYSALLEWRNTPRDEQLQSPAQRLMGRHTRSQLPVLNCHLEPKTIPTEAVRQRLQEIRHKQRSYYNRTTRALPDLHSGNKVSVYDTHSRTWAPAMVVGPAGPPRSYVVATDSGQQLRRTREHLRATDAAQPAQSQAETPKQAAPSTPADAVQAPLRRSERVRQEPQRYPLPERK